MDLYLLLIFIAISVIGVYFSVDISLINSSDLLTTSDESKIPLITINKTYLSKVMNVIRFKKRIPVLYFVLTIYSKTLSLFLLVTSIVLMFILKYEVIALINFIILFINQLIILFTYSFYKKIAIK